MTMLFTGFWCCEYHSLLGKCSCRKYMLPTERKLRLFCVVSSIVGVFGALIEDNLILPSIVDQDPSILIVQGEVANMTMKLLSEIYTIVIIIVWHLVVWYYC